MLEKRATTAKAGLVDVPKRVTVPRGKLWKCDHAALDKIVDSNRAVLDDGDFTAARRTACRVIAKEPLHVYAYSQLIDAITGELRAKPSDRLRDELWVAAWTLLALARRGVDTTYVHPEFCRLYRQKAATALAELALDAPGLVSIADAKRLVAEALAVPCKPDDQMDMTGTWDTRAVRSKLAKHKFGRDES